MQEEYTRLQTNHLSIQRSAKAWKDCTLKFIKNFNLRYEPGIIFRIKNAQKATFVSVIEAHGSYSKVTESSINSTSVIDSLQVVYEDANYVGVKIKNKSGVESLFI